MFCITTSTVAKNDISITIRSRNQQCTYSLMGIRIQFIGQIKTDHTTFCFGATGQ